MELVLKGELPYSSHKLEVMDDYDKWKRSRWETCDEGGEPVATQAQLEASFKAFLVDGAVNEHTQDRRSRESKRRSKAFTPSSTTFALAFAAASLPNSARPSIQLDSRSKKSTSCATIS